MHGKAKGRVDMVGGDVWGDVWGGGMSDRRGEGTVGGCGWVG